MAIDKLTLDIENCYYFYFIGYIKTISYTNAC